MLFRPDAGDFRLIGFYAGKVVLGVAATMLVPAVVAVALGERNEAYGFVIGAGLATIVGAASQIFVRTRAALTTSHGLATVAVSALAVPVFAAVPLLLSGHYASYFDAYFEATSALATVGLSLANDVDHMARSVNLWRHLMQFLGGQGIIVVVLTIFASTSGGVGSLYRAEGSEARLLPGVVRVTSFVWRIAVFYAALGTSLLWGALVVGGLPPATAVAHAVNLFLAAYDTGGFTTMSTDVAFYRSPVVEAVLLVVMTAGAFSFALHYVLWHGRRGELVRNIETRTIFASIIALFAVAAVGLGRSGTFTDASSLFRHGFFSVVSAHTTTGMATVPGRTFVTDWGVLAPAMLVAAMAIGGMAGSTAGGIKAIRIGVVLKGLRRDIRRVLLPESAALVETYHSTTRRVLHDDEVHGAATLLLLFLLLYLAGGAIALYYGYPFDQAMFESTAAASSTGLSVGIVRPDLEVALKAVYLVQMVVGRLEFIGAFALAGYVVAVVRGRV